MIPSFQIVAQHLKMTLRVRMFRPGLPWYSPRKCWHFKSRLLVLRDNLPSYMGHCAKSGRSSGIEPTTRAGLPSLGTRRRMAQCILIRKAYLGRHPRHLQRALSPWISPGKRRQSPRTSPLSIHVQHPNKSFFQRSPLFQAATTWNRFVAATASRDLPSARDISNFFDQ